VIVFWDSGRFAGTVWIEAESRDDAEELARLVRQRAGSRIEFRVYDSQ